MELHGMGCCAWTEIQDLSDCATPEEAMKELCRDLWRTEYDDNYKMHRYLDLGAFYLFTAVSQDENGRVFYRYGHDFAAFIRRNNLGVVKKTQSRYNRRNEPKHMIHSWVWTPSKIRLTKWWKLNGGPDAD